VLTAQILSFALGVLSSLVASWLLFVRARRQYRPRFRSILNLIVGLARTMKEDDFKPDEIVAIDRNGGVVGSILAGHVGLKAVVSVATINKRLSDGSRTIEISPTSLGSLSCLAEKNVLVIICCNDSGTSLGHVVGHLRALGPLVPTEIRTAAVYSSLSPNFRPTYVGAIVGRDTRKSMNEILSSLPWMTPGWNHVFGFERLRKPPALQ
jgi:hypoxanthine phosphoribosyltransferase